jgi:hypothetical protein
MNRSEKYGLRLLSVLCLVTSFIPLHDVFMNTIYFNGRDTWVTPIPFSQAVYQRIWLYNGIVVHVMVTICNIMMAGLMLGLAIGLCYGTKDHTE